MLKNSAAEIVCDSDVERVRLLLARMYVLKVGSSCMAEGY